MISDPAVFKIEDPRLDPDAPASVRADAWAGKTKVAEVKPEQIIHPEPKPVTRDVESPEEPSKY